MEENEQPGLIRDEDSEEVDALMRSLRARGLLVERAGHFVVYDIRHELITIVPPSKLVDTVYNPTTSSRKIRGYRRI
jgi:hypothetical protein